MFSSKDIDPKIRCLVLHQDAGWGARRIAECMKKSVRTIYNWIDAIDEGINITQVREGRGKKSQITEDKKEKIVRTVRRKGATSSTRKLAAQYNVSKGTAHKVLQEKGCKYGKTKIERSVSSTIMEERVEYCENMLKRRAKPIDETFFADEMGIDLVDVVSPEGWSTSRKKLKVEKPQRNVKVNCWGAISRRGATSLEIYKENLNASHYVDIVVEHYQEMEDLYPEGFVYRHDNLKLHKAAETFLEENGFDIGEIPRYSPDLSPIENLWKSLKDRVRNDNPKTESQLVKSLQKNWEVLTEPESLDPYFNTLKNRYNECIDKNGIRLPY